jgi:hypothetical protein
MEIAIKAVKEHSIFIRLPPNIYEFTENQLWCSGAVRFNANTEMTKLLLIRRDTAINENPHAAENKSMDFIFNNQINWVLFIFINL